LVCLYAAIFLNNNSAERHNPAVTVAVAVIGTLSALVLGLMISAAISSFSKRSDEVRELSLEAIRIEPILRRYGPEAAEARGALRA
jgi:hypothetical protein